MDVLRTRPQLVGDAAAPRGGRRRGRRDLGARGDTRARRRHRADPRGRGARRSATPSSSLVENFMFKMSGARSRPAEGPRARRVLHARRGARHERLDVHGTRDRVDAVRHRFGSRRRRRRAQGQAPRRRAEPRVAHDRRDRHGRERGAVATREARRGRAADGVRPPRLPDVRPARSRAREGRRDARGDGRAAGARAPGRGDGAAPPARVQAASPAVHERRVLRGRGARRTSTCPPTCTPRRSPLRAPRAGRRTCSSSLRTTG